MPSCCRRRSDTTSAPLSFMPSPETHTRIGWIVWISAWISTSTWSVTTMPRLIRERNSMTSQKNRAASTSRDFTKTLIPFQPLLNPHSRRSPSPMFLPETRKRNSGAISFTVVSGSISIWKGSGRSSRNPRLA